MSLLFSKVKCKPGFELVYPDNNPYADPNFPVPGMPEGSFMLTCGQKGRFMEQEMGFTGSPLPYCRREL